MARRKNEVTVSSPKLVGNLYYVTLHYRKPGSAKRLKTRYSTKETNKKKAEAASYNIRDEFRIKLYSKELLKSDKAPLQKAIEDYLNRNHFASGWKRQVTAILGRFASHGDL